MKKIVEFSLFIFIILTSCTDVSDFLFETEQNIEIRSIVSGSIYKGGDSFPITISFDREIVPDKFSVTIFDNQGVNWGETLIDILPVELVENEYSTSLVIPDQLPEGKYIFHLWVYESEQEILFKEITIFKTNNDFVIEQLYSMPHETKSGKDVLIKAVIQSPEDIDPFLRWSLYDTILNEGYLSEGLDTLNWLAESDKGLYLIRLEVFPEFCDYSFKSSVSATTEIIVSDQPINEINSLTSEEEYSLLYHFSGDLKPINESDFMNSLYGFLRPDSVDNILGYSFSEDNGLSATGSILPAKSGYITPFSIIGRIALGAGMSPGNLISFANELEVLFSLSINDSGHLIFTSGELISQSAFSIQGLTDFTLSVIPLEIGLEVRWYYDGKNGGIDFFDMTLPEIGSEQTTFIGGNENLSGADMFLDELGVYVGAIINSTIDANHFSRVLEYKLGANLISADGFDGLKLSESLLDYNDILFVENGNLIIPAGNKILLDTFAKSINDVEFIFSFPDQKNNNEYSDEWKIYLTDKNDVELLSFTNGDITVETDIKTGFKSNKLRFSLVTVEESLNTALNGIKPGELLSLFFETNVENNSESLLDSYIIFTNVDSNIPEMIVTVLEEENHL